MFQFQLFQLFFEGVTFLFYYIYIYILISYIIYKRGCRCLIFNWNNWNWNIHDLHFSSTRFMSLRAIIATFKDSVRSLQGVCKLLAVGTSERTLIYRCPVLCRQAMGPSVATAMSSTAATVTKAQTLPGDTQETATIAPTRIFVSPMSVAHSQSRYRAPKLSDSTGIRIKQKKHSTPISDNLQRK